MNRKIDISKHHYSATRDVRTLICLSCNTR